MDSSETDKRTDYERYTGKASGPAFSVPGMTPNGGAGVRGLRKKLRYEVQLDGVVMGWWPTLGDAVRAVCVYGPGARVVMP